MKKAVLIAHGTLIALILFTAGSRAWTWYTAPITGRIGQKAIVHSPLERMGAYNHFFDLCASIQSHEAMLRAQRQALADATTPDDQSRIRANIAGITGQRARVIAQYNADSRKNYTVGQFRDSNLPYQIDLKGDTSCD